MESSYKELADLIQDKQELNDDIEAKIQALITETIKEL
jgi:hypothetical protein